MTYRTVSPFYLCSLVNTQCQTTTCWLSASSEFLLQISSTRGKPVKSFPRKSEMWSVWSIRNLGMANRYHSLNMAPKMIKNQPKKIWSFQRCHLTFDSLPICQACESILDTFAPLLQRDHDRWVLWPHISDLGEMVTWCHGQGCRGPIGDDKLIPPLMTGILIMGLYKPLRIWVDEFIPYYMEIMGVDRPWHTW